MNYLIIFLKYYWIYFVLIILLITYVVYQLNRKKKTVGSVILIIFIFVHLGLQIGCYDIKVKKAVHENELLGLNLQEISLIYYTPKHDENYYEKIKDGETWYWAVLEQRYEGADRLNNAYYVKLNEEGRVISIWKVDLRGKSLGWTESKY